MANFKAMDTAVYCILWCVAMECGGNRKTQYCLRLLYWSKFLWRVGKFYCTTQYHARRHYSSYSFFSDHPRYDLEQFLHIVFISHKTFACMLCTYRIGFNTILLSDLVASQLYLFSIFQLKLCVHFSGNKVWPEWMFGLKSEEVTRDWRHLYNEEFYDVQSLSMSLELSNQNVRMNCI
jgi:hypothetical protein